VKANPSTTDSGSAPALFESRLALPDRRRGKVRDVYRLPGEPGQTPDRVVMIASDRVSAFDVVLPTPIAGKGRLLTTIAAFWLRWIEARGLCQTHLLSTEAGDLPESAFTDETPIGAIRGRVTIGRACRVIPIECVVRGYLEGSGWKDYQQTGAVCGHELPAGLVRCGRLPEPIFTPATKAEEGHDENISEDQAARVIGREMIERLRAVSLTIYAAASAYAQERGIILADTKFEFGLPLGADGEPEQDAEPILIDEALTPDSSRFWPADSYEPGRAQASYDKQFVREYLQGLVDAGSWDKADPGPALPEGVIAGTLDRYRAATDRLTGPTA
jgi:phosphoribosylaminoimidazole-succinocarboxamide synthase